MRRVNDKSKAYWNKAFTLDYDKNKDILGTTPKMFRYKNLRKGDVVGSQLLAGWIMSDGSKMISTDSQRIIDRGENIRGDKYLESTQKIKILTTQIDPDLEAGAYDPIFGTPLAGTSEDVRSVGFIDVVSGADYKFYLVGVDEAQADYNFIGTFGSVDSSTGGDLPQFNTDTITSKGTFGSSGSTTGGDLPSVGNVLGDQYVCNLNDFFSEEASNTFDINDTATFTDPGWIKNATIVEVNDGYLCDTNNFDSVVAGLTYQSNEVARLNSAFTWDIISDTNVVNVLQFDENDSTTTTVELIEFNQTLTLESDTVKVKIWAANILLEDDEIITTYRISQEEEEFNAISEVIEYEVMEDPDQLVGAIRRRKNRDITIMKLS